MFDIWMESVQYWGFIPLVKSISKQPFLFITSSELFYYLFIKMVTLLLNKWKEVFLVLVVGVLSREDRGKPKVTSQNPTVIYSYFSECVRLRVFGPQLPSWGWAGRGEEREREKSELPPRNFPPARLFVCLPEKTQEIRDGFVGGRHSSCTEKLVLKIQ